MNQHTAHETAAAIELREHAERLACTYAEPRDIAATKLAILMQAAQNEAREQGITAPLVFSYDGEQE